jgi:hypothetical protein
MTDNLKGVYIISRWLKVALLVACRDINLLLYDDHIFTNLIGEFLDIYGQDLRLINSWFITPPRLE